MADGEKLLREALELLSQYRMDEAIAKAEEALETEMDGEWMEERGQQFPRTNRSKAFYVIGTARSEKGDKKGGIEALDQALKLIPDDPICFSNRAVAKRDLGDEEGALADFSRALELRPEYAHARANRARLYGKRGEVTEALADYELLLKIADTPEHRAERDKLRG
jgi:tetratricopeptide (TPR) repeat protein